MPIFDVTRVVTTVTAQRIVKRVRAPNREEAIKKTAHLSNSAFEAKEAPVFLGQHVATEGATLKGERYS